MAEERHRFDLAELRKGSRVFHSKKGNDSTFDYMNNNFLDEAKEDPLANMSSADRRPSPL